MKDRIALHISPCYRFKNSLHFSRFLTNHLPFVFAGRRQMFLQNWNLAEIYMSIHSVRYYKIAVKNWIRCCKTRFSGAPSSDSNEANREESPEKPGSNGKRRMRWRCGRERKGCRLTRFALSRRWRFYSREFTTLRSQPFLRSEVISEFSRQAGLFSLFPASSRNAALRGRCESRERKQSAIPFVITSCILQVSRPLHRENKQKPNI